MNWLRRQLPLLLLLACGVPAVYFADPEGLRALEQELAPPVVNEIAPPGDPQVPQAHAVLRMPPAWFGALLHTTGKHAEIELPADPRARELGRQAQSYLDEIAAARAFLDAYRTTAIPLPAWGPAHPYALALRQRRADLVLAAALDRHRLGDADSVNDLKSQRRGAETFYQNRQLPLCIDALVKLEELRAQYRPPVARVNQWLISWEIQSVSSDQTIQDLQRRSRDYRDFCDDYPFAKAWVRSAEEEARKADRLVKALSQLQRNDPAAALQNLHALRVLLSLLDPGRHPQAFAVARQAVLQACVAEAPPPLPLDKVRIGSLRQSAFERSAVKIEWEDGAITALDHPHGGIVYHEGELRRLDKGRKRKITIRTPLGSSSPDDLTASDATTYAVAFNQSAQKLRERLEEPTSYRGIAEAFRALHQVANRMDTARRAGLLDLADELDRFQRWDP